MGRKAVYQRLIFAGLLAGACDPNALPDSNTRIAGIEVDPATRDLVAGQRQQFDYLVFDANGALLDRPVFWSSSNTAVATVDQNGYVTGVHTGVTTISARNANVAGLSQVTVNQGGMTTADSGIIYSDDHTLSVTRFKGSFGLNALTIRKLPTPTTPNVVPGSAWSVETAAPAEYFWITIPYIPATLPAGTNPLHLQLLNLRSGRSLGGNIVDTVQHTVTLQTLEGVDSFAVFPVPFAATNLTIDGPATMHVGETEDFGVLANADIAGFGVTWTCSNTTVIDCGRYGVFTALAPGTVTITARLAELAATKTVTVSP